MSDEIWERRWERLDGTVIARAWYTAWHGPPARAWAAGEEIGGEYRIVDVPASERRERLEIEKRGV